jgi:4-pyridoxolactonase
MDVAYTADAMEKGIQPGFHNNPHDGVLSIARVKKVAGEHGAEILYSHDMEAWQSYVHAPRHYEV